MTSSLAQQLQKLAVPQSSIYKETKKKTSLLFDPKEAAKKDRDYFYEIGCKGLKELININESFRVYEDTLFGPSSKDFERAMQTKKVNDNLNVTIEKFLKQIFPYVMLPVSHKALEWLINRYSIHEYNTDALMASVLPYHETFVFVRFVQLLDLSNPNSRWHWLLFIQKGGVPLRRPELYKHCTKNYDILRFMSKAVIDYTNDFGEKALHLSTMYAFFCSLCIGTLSIGPATEGYVNAILPAVMNGLSSPTKDFRSAIEVILAFVFGQSNMQIKILDEILIRLLTSEVGITYDMILLTNMICLWQGHYKRIPSEVIYCISSEQMLTICGYLTKIISKNISIESFVLNFLQSVLPLMQENFEEFSRTRVLPELLIDEVDLSAQHPVSIISCVFNTFKPQGEMNGANKNNESDLEIIEEDVTSKILMWYSTFLKNLERKYPEAFDKVIKSLLNSKSAISKKRHAELTKVLSFSPAVSHKIGDAYLFEMLLNPNAALRVQAVNYINENIEALTDDFSEFLNDALVNRLYDDNPDVVNACLEISSDNFNSTLSSSNLEGVFVHILGNGFNKHKKWRLITEKTIDKFCALSNFPVTQDIVFSLLPYLFPKDSNTKAIAMNIIESNWGQRFSLTRKIASDLNSDSKAEEICTLIHEICKTEPINITLDYDNVDKTKPLNICLYFYLKVQTFHETSLKEVNTILGNLTEFIEKSQVVMLPDDNNFFSPTAMSKIVKLAKQGTVAFPIIHYLFSSIITDTNLSISKPWVNVCESTETILCRHLYESFYVGTNIDEFRVYYIDLLQKLLHKLCSDGKEIMEFLANMACGHTLFADDPKDIVTPELSLRAMKMFFHGIEQNSQWIFNSNAVISMILINLNNPLSIIRDCTLQIIEKMLSLSCASNNMVELMKKLFEHKEELLLDHEQISHVLKTVLTQTGNKLFRKNCLNKLISISEEAPAHISAELLRILGKFNNSQVLVQLVKAADKITKKMEANQSASFQLNVYESKLLRHLISRINESTVSSFSNECVWSFVKLCMKEHRTVILLEDQSSIPPSVLTMKQITEEGFKNIPDKRCEEMIRLICSAGTFSNNPSISSVAAKVFKKIHITISQFKPVLEEMVNVSAPAKKGRPTVSMIPSQLSETSEWRLGVTLIEYIQSKTNIEVDTSFVALLFNILKKCLKFEEQSCVEYPKQLILSLLWAYCKKFMNENDPKELKSIFDIECVVLCIRGTQNPQTHHHALILLSHAAYMLPEQVLHHTMEIFTFMGSSVLRHDDAYSFQIINKIIETLIPILVDMDRDIEAYNESEFVKLQSRVVPVLRIFADVVLHVPEHRRLPLYKKLLETLGAKKFLWIFLALLLESHIAHWTEDKGKPKKNNRNLADQESPINRLDFGQSILLEFPPEIVFENLVRVITFVKSLPVQKEDNAMATDINPSELFSVNGHTALQLRHYKYVLITFMNTALSSPNLIEHTKTAAEEQIMENNYKSLIINMLTFIQNITKISDEKTMKYWRVMLHHSYDLLDNVINLLSPPMFISVTRGLLKHNLHTVRRKSMELLNTKMQSNPEFFEKCDKALILTLVPSLIEIIEALQTTDETLSEATRLDLELNQQTALLSMKLIIRLDNQSNPETFKEVLEKITKYISELNMSDNVMASMVLCLGELCYSLKAHSLTWLRKFMPSLIRVLKKQREAETPEIILLSTVTAILKIVESLPRFLSPYLSKVLFEYSLLLAKWERCDQSDPKVLAIVTKLNNLKMKIAGTIAPRVLIPVISETYGMVLEKEYYQGVGPLMAVLAESFGNFTSADFSAVQQDLTAFFLSTLQLRSDTDEKEVDLAIIDNAEGEVVNAFVGLVLKLSETSFRPFYFKIYDWAIRSNVEGHKDRAITFYRLSSAIADKLKGLFVLFAGHFIKNAADLLDSCNPSKTEQLFFESDDKCSSLIQYILKTLRIVFLYDNQSFINRERFDTLLQPVVDQLENTLMGLHELNKRASEVLIPCISQFAVAIADDSLWKLLNYQILLKTRHNDAEIRLIALQCLVSVASQLGSSWLPLLAESIPFLAELLEDGDQKIENATKEAIRQLEHILGEPLEKYF